MRDFVNVLMLTIAFLMMYAIMIEISGLGIMLLDNQCGIFIRKVIVNVKLDSLVRSVYLLHSQTEAISCRLRQNRPDHEHRRNGHAGECRRRKAEVAGEGRTRRVDEPKFPV